MEAIFNQHGKLKNIISEFVLKTRMEQSISQEHLAMKLGMAQGSYSKKEKGYSEFTLSQLEIIIFEFNMTLPEFFLKVFCEGKSMQSAVSGYVQGLNPQQKEKMQHRLNKEKLQNSNLIMISMLLLDELE